MPGHPTPRQTFRKLNKCSILQLILSLVTIRELQMPLPCVLTSCGIHYTPDVASEMPLCFFKIHHILVCISLPTIIYTADVCTRRHHKYKPRTLPASCMIYQHSFYVCSIPMWNSLTQEAVMAATAEEFQKAIIKIITSS